MDELISREAVKEMMKNHRVDFSTEKDYRTARACANAVPPAQPQIIRCKDCIYSGTPDEEKWRLCHHDGAQWNEENHFCGYAERRTE